MRAITNLFGKSPFHPLQEHMNLVAKCVKKLKPLFEAYKSQDWNKVESLSKEISHIEHLADLAKMDIRNHLPKNLFLPVEREILLNILSIQDHIADAVEDVAVYLTMKNLTLKEDLYKDLSAFIDKNIHCFEKVHQVIAELHELFQSSFGGVEAESVIAMIEDVIYQENQTDISQRVLLKKLFNLEHELSYSSFHLIMQVLEWIGQISYLSEKLASCTRMTIERK